MQGVKKMMVENDCFLIFKIVAGTTERTLTRTQEDDLSYPEDTRVTSLISTRIRLRHLYKR